MNPENPRKGNKHVLIIIMKGVSGTGKSTLGRALAEAIAVPFIDGDDLHPQANVDKMAGGQELTDTDRAPWLADIRTTAEHMFAETEQLTRLVVACSALKRCYRDVLRGRTTGPGYLPPVATCFVYIKEDTDVLQERMEKRQGHFMKVGMLESQIKTLEVPEGEDDVVVVPLSASTEEQVELARQGLAIIL